MGAQTLYARSGDVSIAYQVTGAGLFDVVFIPGSVSHIEMAWQVPTFREFFERLGSFARLVIFDKRGTGMSDRADGATPLETRMDDVRAVMDAAGSERAAIMGVSEGVPMSVLFAATYPDRTGALVLYGGFARWLWAPDFPLGDAGGGVLAGDRGHAGTVSRAGVPRAARSAGVAECRRG